MVLINEKWIKINEKGKASPYRHRPVAFQSVPETASHGPIW